MKKTILANQQPVELETGPHGLTIILHPQGIRVDIPESIEINSRNTIKCMEEMTDRAWYHISTGQLFQHLFYTIFPEDDFGIKIPARIESLLKQDYGVQHICGLIVLTCEAFFKAQDENKPITVFFRTPEDHLHPKAERRLVTLIKEMQKIFGVGNSEPEEVE